MTKLARLLRGHESVRTHPRSTRRFRGRSPRGTSPRSASQACETSLRRRLRDETQSDPNRHIEPEARWYKRWPMETTGSSSRPLRLGFPKSRVGPTRRATPHVAPLTPVAAPPGTDDFAAVSVVMRQVYALIRQLATTDVTLTLTGETGTGKDVLAHLAHNASPRARAPFVVFDCGAVPPNLVESELFGHERGSFTGAHADHLGAFERA